MIKKAARAIFNRQTFSDLLVFWFATWILWWFRRWVGHGPAYFPNTTNSGARLYYTVEMRTLVRSLLQSLVIASLALAAWRGFRYWQAAAQRNSK
jgi:hypothetical protein